MIEAIGQAICDRHIGTPQEMLGWSTPDLASTVNVVESDFWIGYPSMRHKVISFQSIRTLGTSIPAIKSLINASTQTFGIGTRKINSYHGS